ncbi:MAG: acetolactate synthase catalytic subunit [Acidobacteriia bacterium]|nr:acetolactate synthase catalytic subunit [Terriglobia bacterium]
MSPEKTVAQVIAAALARHGVKTIFSQSLPSAVLLAAEDLGIRQFTYRTENAGSYMADACARLTGQISVVTAQNGPAATLLVPGLAEAIKSSIPIVALVQDVNLPTTDRNAFQEFDHFGLFQSCAKWIRRVTEPERIEDYVDMAFAAATSGRPGPAVLLLPADVLNERVTVPLRRHANLGSFPLDRSLADPALLRAAADLIASAKMPLLVAGGGIHLSNASAELAALQETAHLPVMTTVMGKGAVDERHPLSLGVGGYNLGRMSPGRHLRPLIEQSDLIFFVGTRTAQNGTDSWSLFPPSARYVHLDIDPVEIGRNYEGLRLVGDAKLTLPALTELLRGRCKPRPEYAQAIAAAFARGAGDIAPLLQSDASPIRPERLMADLQQVLTPDTIVVADASYSTVWVACYLRALAPGMRFITPRGIAGLGWGFPMALGARVARPSSPILCISGDGGFAHVWSELETSLRMRAPVVLTVLNNGVLGYQKDAEDVKFGRHTSACYFAPVDHAQIARACGCRGVTITRPADYLPAVREALAAKETTVIDVITDPGAYPPVAFFDERLETVRKSSGR